MKLVIVLCIFVMSVYVVHAADANVLSPNGSASEASALQNAQGNSGLALERAIAFPGNTKNIVDTLFRFSTEEPISVHLFILLLVIWGVVVLVLQQILRLVPFFEREWMSLAAAAIITSIASVAGAVRESALYLQGLGKGVQFLGSSGILRLTLIVVVLILAYYAVSRAVSALQRGERVSSAEQTGFDAGFHAPRP